MCSAVTKIVLAAPCLTLRLGMADSQEFESYYFGLNGHKQVEESVLSSNVSKSSYDK